MNASKLEGVDLDRAVLLIAAMRCYVAAKGGRPKDEDGEPI